MTDKPIIINGVNVAECKYFLYRKKEEISERSCGVGLTNCKSQDCQFKQLQRLKADLKEALKQLEFSRTHKTVLETELQRLKAEYDKYKQALEEIKTIAGNRFVSGLNEEADCYNNDMEMILTKINEVLK